MEDIKYETDDTVCWKSLIVLDGKKYVALAEVGEVTLDRIALQERFKTALMDVMKFVPEGRWERTEAEKVLKGRG